MNKEKKKEILIKNLSTKKERTYYIEPNKKPEIPERIKYLIEQQKRWEAFTRPAAVYNEALRFQLEIKGQNKAFYITNEILKPYKAWHEEFTPKFKYNNGLYKTLKSL